MALQYELLGQVKNARAANLHLPHGNVRTPGSAYQESVLFYNFI
jgi:hypothetical protein